MADHYDLSDEQKEFALVKAYERHAERLAANEEQRQAPGSVGG
jgi:hypothetical protein